MIHEWGYNFLKNFERCFRGRNLVWHLLAIVLTYLLVTSDFDWQYFEATRNATLFAIGFSATIVGFIVPIVVLVSVYLWGVVRSYPTMKVVTAALGQSAIMGWLISSLYKVFTGRIQPYLSLQTSAYDISKNFNFGFYNHGIFWGWPSSHTTVAFAMAAALIVLYPRRRAIAVGAILYAFYIGLGVSVTVHWFSDFVAGAILGTMIGIVVGASYRDRTVKAV